MTRYSLKKAFLCEDITSKHNLLEEGFWADLAMTLAAGGPEALKQMAQNKLESLLGKGGEIETNATLDMIARFKRMGLSSMWGHDLGTVEKQLQQRKAKGKKKESAKELLAAFLKAEGEGENIKQNENTSPFRGRSLASVFLDD